MDEIFHKGMTEKYFLPYHWTRDPLSNYHLIYRGYQDLALSHLLEDAETVLDFGCGDGLFSARLANKGLDVIGVDIVDRAIKFAELLVPDVDFHLHDGREPLIGKVAERDSIDQVFMIDVYEHIPPKDCPAILENIKTVLKPNGALTLSVPTKLIPMGKLHYRHFDLEEIKQELEQVGFEITNIVGQEKLGIMRNILFSGVLEYLGNNPFVSLTAMRILRRKIYFHMINKVEDINRAGHFLITATKK